MRDAEEAEERRLREELEKKHKAIHDARMAKKRGKSALDQEKRLLEEKYQLEE